MTGAPIVQIDGNLTADPVLRHTQSGIPVASFDVASTERRINKDTGQWEDGDTVFLRVNVWREHGENVSATLKKGDAVVVIGRVKQRPWETEAGEKRVSTEVDADVVSVDLRRQRAQQVARYKSGASRALGDADAPEAWTPERSAPLQAVVDRVTDAA